MRWNQCKTQSDKLRYFSMQKPCFAEIIPEPFAEFRYVGRLGCRIVRYGKTRYYISKENAIKDAERFKEWTIQLLKESE